MVSRSQIIENALKKYYVIGDHKTVFSAIRKGLCVDGELPLGDLQGKREDAQQGDRGRARKYLHVHGSAVQMRSAALFPFHNSLLRISRVRIFIQEEFGDGLPVHTPRHRCEHCAWVSRHDGFPNVCAHNGLLWHYFVRSVFLNGGSQYTGDAEAYRQRCETVEFASQ